ncbi:glycoside hydrolase superfamily [Cokeromyces recurvatus]|uniref:glycoside hydrolase superfamily n=1 Tax=Cokeromyces recurvatus TaxID=90255 RepID=UPI00221F8253|nr:glycoside hydrolase superfamily [Cokeromyces recurvatus]KAI7907795.1 glycoside hydrolase superfamily [Cokeromyces recurvatus]
MLYIFLIVTAFIAFVQAVPIEPRVITSLSGVSYNSRNPDGSCQTTQEAIDTIKSMKLHGIQHIRTYSQGCNALPNIIKGIEAAGGGMTVLAAVWIDGTSNDDKEIALLEENLNTISDLKAIRGILVGNEVLFNNYITSSQLVQRLNSVRAISRGIPVGSAETDGSYSDELIAASDFMGVNIHPYFDTSVTTIEDAYKNLVLRFNNIKGRAGDKTIYITETGWPSAGSGSGAGQPSLSNMEAYATTVSKSSLPYYYFEWIDATWKSSASIEVCPVVLIYAQLGPTIIKPEQNATVPAGGQFDIVYEYQNMGTGNYSIDIQVWQDAAVSLPIFDIVKDHKIKSGNSSGIQISFRMNDSYTWKVQRGLNQTFWLTVTETAQTAFYSKGISLRSRPVLLHTSHATKISLSLPILISLVGFSFILMITLFV